MLKKSQLVDKFFQNAFILERSPLFLWPQVSPNQGPFQWQQLQLLSLTFHNFSILWSDPCICLCFFYSICSVWSARMTNHLFEMRCPWCNGYRRRKWIRWHEFKSWTRLIAFHIALIPLGKVWIQLFSLQLWVNSRADWVLQPWWGN